MPLKSYGVLSGRVVKTRREGSSASPHYQIHLVDDAGTHYRAAVNVQSAQAPSELRYLVVDDFRHPVTGALPAAGSGWTPLAAGPGGANLDYIRANLFDPAAMRLLPPDVTGPDNDLADLLDHYVQRAQADPQVTPARIVAALVNPVGPAPEAATITLINASPGPIDLTGWQLADRANHTCTIPAGTIAAGATLVVTPSDGVALGNNGGTLTLLDPQGLKVHGVSYTAEQASDEGWTLVF